MTDDAKKATPKALQEWRAAEQVVAVARRGRLAAQVATEAAQQAEEAAMATSVAAKAALAATAAAEASASETAKAANVVVLAAQADVDDSESEVALAEVGETEAHGRYRDAYSRAAENAAAPRDESTRDTW